MSIYINEFEKMYSSSQNTKGLRKRICELAISGRLVEVDNKDRNVDDYLKLITVERLAKAKMKEIGNKKKDYSINDEVDLMEIPSHWRWSSFGNISYNYDGRRIPLSKNVRATIEKVYDYYGASGVIDKVEDYIFDEPLLLIGEDGANLITRSKPIAFIAQGKYWVNNHAHVMSFRDMTLMKYIELYINTIDLKPYVTGTAQPKMNQAKMNSIPIAIPPLEEQKLIVERVGILMKQIDCLEEKLIKKEHLLELLPQAVVDVIGSCQTSKELKSQLEFVIENFEEIFQNPESMQDLRNVILQLAIEGKLVEQDGNDEPASVLVERIKEERAQLVKEKKIKKPKKLEPISESDIPFEIPERWEWVRASEVCHMINYGYTAKALSNDTGTKMLRITDIQNGKVNWETVPFCAIEEKKLAGYVLNRNDVVIARTGGTVGKSFIVKDIDCQSVYASYLIRLLPSREMNVDYFYSYLQSPYYWEQLTEGARGGAQPNVNATTLGNLIVPLPPMREQIRINKRVNIIMAIIDDMEEKLKKKQRIVELLGTV